MQLFSNKYRDNICPPLSSPIVDFNIELYGATKELIPIDTMLKAQNPEDYPSLNNSLKDLIRENMLSLSLCISIFSIDNFLSKTHIFQNKSMWIWWSPPQIWILTSDWSMQWPIEKLEANSNEWLVNTKCICILQDHKTHLWHNFTDI